MIGTNRDQTGAQDEVGLTGHDQHLWTELLETSCARGDTIYPRPSPLPVGAPAPRAPPSRRNVAVVSHAQYVLTVTAAPASRVKAAVVKQPGDLDLLTLKVVSESRVTWATSVPILVFLGLSVLDLVPIRGVRVEHFSYPTRTRT